METTPWIWMDGEFVPWNDAKVHVLTHTLHYGTGVFEGIRAYKTDKGTAIFQLEPHIERLFYSSTVIGMKIPFSKDQVADTCLEVFAKNKLEQGYLRPLAYYGYGNMGVRPKTSPTCLMIACWPWDAYLPHDVVDIKITRFCRIDPKTLVTQAKICGHYVNSLLAAMELQGTKYHEALMLDTEGHIAEGPGENFFMAQAGTLYTPRLGSILPGITRATIIRMARDMGLQVTEKQISPAEVFEADEAFFTGTATEIAPIRSIDDRVIGSGTAGPLTTKIRNTYLDAVYGRRKEYLDLLTLVD